MRKRLGIAALALALVLVAQPAAALFFVVHDPWRLIYERVAAELHLRIVGLNVDIYTSLRRMGRRLDIFVSSGRYISVGVPLWRTWNGEPSQPDAANFLAALNGTTPAPIAPLPAIGEEAIPGWLELDIQNALLADAIARTGAIRAARKDERAALAALETAIEGEGGATSRADVINAGELVAVRQRQSRLALTAALMDALLPEALHARGVARIRLQMQAAGQEPPLDLTTGSEAALRAWRQP